ncbi:D-alanyl-D-alanine carboxypeptidase family protein [Lyticum sinuosum]|uniref:D-alanyl-D-alanine carboxypeptidase N-terminal domain protein n=1 Tax=Lyticum sinuosum TaxID=1332059 RepID=A0AAE5AH17_9RICK|nr:D-alanyl-D-alanine carboxypeptidase family protein [Lyticum sinuosum]MDZ5761055.1 D-alanyl-D-alanine carboxypeptidase N-terminal domain protein [Lyticum sinuosum]
MYKILIFSVICLFIIIPSLNEVSAQSTFNRNININKSSHTNNDITKNKKYAAIVVDTSRNLVLYKKNDKARRYPASLTKIMTLYILFDEIKKGRIKMNSQIYVSQSANSIPPSKLPIKVGDFITVEDAIYALIIKSANNISYAIAEKVAGSESKFVLLMNKKAKELKMFNTNFVNSHGWHNPHQYTTAYDMAILSISLQKAHPKKYKMFSKKSFKFRGQVISTHNNVLKEYPGVDGIKTGYIMPSGFNLITSVKKNNIGTIIAVVMGGTTPVQRDEHMIELINTSYKFIEKKYRPISDPKSIFLVSNPKIKIRQKKFG